MYQLPNRIYLTGFMAVGKSTIGRILANTIGYNFLDLDHALAAREGMPVVDIFKVKGESYFRKEEATLLRQISEQNRVLVSLGGGTICFGDNCEFMKRNGVLVHIKVNPETLFLRIRAKKDRPIFLNEQGDMLPDDAIKVKISEMMTQRLPFYEQAHITYEPQEQPVGQSVDQLKHILEHWQGLKPEPGTRDNK